ncbi:MAG: serine/threonine protein kinase [Deltaproteobacteria bacterium]|nr:serine/threonine protein kinase [Deltaproteobacteria bacterium]
MQLGRGPSVPSSAGMQVFDESDDHAFAQRRLAMTYAIFCAIVTGFLVLSVTMSAIVVPQRFWELNISAMRGLHVLAIAMLAGAVVFCRGPLRAKWMLATFDLVGLLDIMALSSTMIALAPPGGRAELIGPVIYVTIVTLRAALVPSPPKWTALVAAVAALPVPFGAYFAAIRDTTWDESVFPRSFAVAFSAAWGVAGTLTAWAISRVVYGLRVEVKSATRLGQYTLEDKIGEGGMGEVYRARHALLRRPTAIKLLSPDRAGGSASVRRFEREVQLTSKLTHPNTIAIYDYGHTRDGIFYYAMELLDGVSLHDLCDDDGPQPASRVAHILAQVASALAEAHDVGLIHRDVKPANILLCERGGIPDFVKVLDFGLVKDASEGGADPQLSSANTIAGTPLYMAPESITKPKEIDARVDLYALGCVGFWLLTARPPFEGANLVEICSHHLHTAPTRPSEILGKPVDVRLEDLLLKCLAKSPDQRPASARVLAEALREVASALAWTEADARRWWTERARKSPASGRAPRTRDSAFEDTEKAFAQP